ncbi:hypothetical protein AB0H83_35140 [Dactylosporangium sp. NPDC050688]|uniref:hypothetical protein n=1 Tax=Dactylosporangium sp. NPDC050688 TaxID=3157217 RepID=UPI0033F31272
MSSQPSQRSEHRTDTRHEAPLPSHHPFGATDCAAGCAASSQRHRIAAETREVAITSAGFAADLLPPHWTAHAAPTADGSVYLLILTPGTGTGRAELVAPHAGRGWAIGITDPVTGTDTVLRTTDGDVAYQATLADAVRAARAALQPPAQPMPDSTPLRPVPTGRYIDSNCLIGVTDPRYPHIVRARTVGSGGHPHAMLPTLRRIWAANSHDSRALVTRLLAHDWHYLDPTTGTRTSVTDHRRIAGIGLADSPDARHNADTEPEPACVVPLTAVGELDTAWLYLLDPAEDTVTVHTGDGDPISRHPLQH